MRYSLTNIFIVILFLLGLTLLTFQNFNNDFNLITQINLFVTYLICSIIIIFYIFSKSFNNFIPLLPLTCFFFLVCYLSPSFFNFEFFRNSDQYNVSDIPFAIEVLTLGIITMLIGFFIAMFLFRNVRRKGFEILNLSINEIFIYGLVINLLTIVLYYIFKIQLTYPIFFQLKYVFLFFGFGLFTSSLIHGKSFFNSRSIFMFSCKIFIIINEILSGAYALPFILIFLDYMYFSYLKKKFYISPIIIFFIVFFVVHEGKQKYRNFTWNKISTEEVKTQNFYDNSRYFLKTYHEILSDNSLLGKFLDGNIYTYKRIYHSFDSLLIVTSKTPREISYWNGYSYEILLSKIIPRMFWKDKPSDTLGNEFGHRYNILINFDDFKDMNTSWNMPVLNEFYVNFGKRGVMIGMLLIGFIFGLITKLFTFKNNLNIESIISFYLFIPLFFLESHLSILFGAIAQSYFFLLTGSVFFVLFVRKIHKIYL